MKIKKLICVILSAVMLFCCLPLSSFAESENSSSPVILVPGLIENLLYRDKGTENEKLIWPPNADTIAPAMKKYFGTMTKSFIKSLSTDNAEFAADCADFAYAVVGDLAMNPDGTSVYNVSPVVTGAENCSYKALKDKNMLKDVTYGTTMMTSLAEKIGDDNVFVFQYDWRYGAEKVSQELHAFIKDVEKLTGSDKVSVSGTSFGSNILAAYIANYGAEGDLDNVLMNSPAMGGSSLFETAFASDKADFTIDGTTGLTMILRNFLIDFDFENLLNLLPDELVKDVVWEVKNKVVAPIFASCVSFWDCCSLSTYDSMKNSMLDKYENSGIIAQSDKYHYGVMANLKELLNGVSQYGTTVYIISNNGTSLVIPNGDSGDGLVDIASGSGASVIYNLTGTSPDGTLDMSTGYIPDRTWIFYGQKHGQSYWDSTSRELSIKLLTSDVTVTVSTYEEYPQFMESHSPADGVSVRFDGYTSSIVETSDTINITVSNDSTWRTVIVKDVSVGGVSYEATGTTSMILLPGKTRTISLKATGTASSHEIGVIEVNFTELPSVSLQKSRTQYFTIK